jgi:hypothetical protein
VQFPRFGLENLDHDPLWLSLRDEFTLLLAELEADGTHGERLQRIQRLMADPQLLKPEQIYFVPTELFRTTDAKVTKFCWVCGRDVSLEKCKTDEHGLTVHEQCLAKRKKPKSDSARPKPSQPRDSSPDRTAAASASDASRES